MKSILWGLVLTALTYGAGYYRGYTSSVADDNEQKLQRMFDESEAVIGEMRDLSADARAVLAEAKKANQTRNQAGEERRKNITEGMRDDSCASALAPVAVSDGLLRKNKSSNAADSRADTGKPDR
ncbi:hypothetical protein IGG11_001485 [Escherichia coli]|nr:hypothetical protein [Escherichia coli]EHO8309523.1 hypothetical protein [Escherichia coli]EJT5104023.1 hypothetical protein [Escherichia coli]MEB7199303.1 hypothetical protein [Escherichia coli]HBB3504848.1 hypothetical protein [Escherichia coli]